MLAITTSPTRADQRLDAARPGPGRPAAQEEPGRTDRQREAAVGKRAAIPYRTPTVLLPAAFSVSWDTDVTDEAPTLNVNAPDTGCESAEITCQATV